MINLDNTEFSVKWSDGRFTVTALPIGEDSFWGCGVTYSDAVRCYLDIHPLTTEEDRRWINFSYDFMMEKIDKCISDFPYTFMRGDFNSLKLAIQSHIESPRLRPQIYSVNSDFWWFMNTVIRLCSTCDKDLINAANFRANTITNCIYLLEEVRRATI